MVGALAFPGVAGAASGGYPPPTIPNTSCSYTESVNVNSTITVTPACTFAPGSTITITFNGSAYGTATAPPSGQFVETFTATDPHLALNGGTPIETAFGAVNTIVASGTNPSGGTNVATTLVTIPTTVTAAAVTPSVAFTGADIMAMVIGALALLALGFLVLIFSRRRSTSSS